MSTTFLTWCGNRTRNSPRCKRRGCKADLGSAGSWSSKSPPATWRRRHDDSTVQQQDPYASHTSWFDDQKLGELVWKMFCGSGCFLNSDRSKQKYINCWDSKNRSWKDLAPLSTYGSRLVATYGSNQIHSDCFQVFMGGTLFKPLCNPVLSLSSALGVTSAGLLVSLFNPICGVSFRASFGSKFVWMETMLFP